MISCYQFGSFQLDPVKRLLIRDHQVVSLTPKAVEILLLLVERAGEIVEKDQIIKHIWPDTVVEEGNLSVNISSLRKALGENLHQHRFILTHSGRGYSFIAEVSKVETADHNIVNQQPEKSQNESLERIKSEQPNGAAAAIVEPVGGALPLDSPFYIERPADAEFFSAITRYDSLVLVKGRVRSEKTSLLARGLQQAREWGARVVLTDLQHLNSTYFESIDKFFLMLAELIADQLDLDFHPSATWNAHIGASSNFERFWRREALSRVETPIVWGLDEIDRLFNYPFASEVFGLFRSWHNKRALDPEGPWSRLTLAMAYATEAHLFITDLNQSPFNVGTRLQLEDFSLAQMRELNQRYGAPIQDDVELQQLLDFVGGHPYLVNRSLWEIKQRGASLTDLLSQADRDEGLYSDHLRRLFLALSRDPELSSVILDLLHDRPCRSLESFFRLRSAGVIKGASAGEAVLRCELYRIYLRSRL